MDEPTTHPKIVLTVLQFVLPIALAMLAGYGTVKFTQGQTEQRLSGHDAAIKANADAIQRCQERSVSREELKIYMESQTSILNSIQADVRAMRENGR